MTLACACDRATASHTAMGRPLGNLRPVTAARRSVAVFAPALLLAGCFGTKTPTERAADYARMFAWAHGLTVARVDCSADGASWMCAGRLKSGRTFTCRVGPSGRVGQTGACTVERPRP